MDDDGVRSCKTQGELMGGNQSAGAWWRDDGEAREKGTAAASRQSLVRVCIRLRMLMWSSTYEREK